MSIFEEYGAFKICYNIFKKYVEYLGTYKSDFSGILFQAKGFSF